MDFISDLQNKMMSRNTRRSRLSSIKSAIEALKIDGYITSDTTPPDLACSEITFDLDTKGFGHLFSLKRSSTDGQGNIVKVDKEFDLKPLREKPRTVELSMGILTHVVLDRAKSSRADQ